MSDRREITLVAAKPLNPFWSCIMNTKSIELFSNLHTVCRTIGIAVWGLSAFLLLWSPDASASNAKHLDRGSLVLMSPREVSSETGTEGYDMYLHEGNGRNYLYVEQDGGSRLLVLDVTNPQRTRRVAYVSIAVDGPYDFVSPLGTDSVLVRLRNKDGQASGWGRLEIKKPASPSLATWIQKTGEILDPVDNQSVDAGGLTWRRADSTDPFPVVDASYSEPRLLGTIPGVKKTLVDGSCGHKFYLASDGVWILRNLEVEREYESQSNPTN